MPWVTYLWPGLPQLWRQGLWIGLTWAVGFGLLLNGLLMASLVWVELLSPGMLRAGWLVTGGIWLASVVTSAWYGWGVAPRRAHSAEAMFREAQSEYLQGKWFEAEQILGQLLEIQPRDVEARLMLATLLKHNGRLNEAAEQLRRLELLQDARTWALEIEVEKQAIAELVLEHQEHLQQMQAAAENEGTPEEIEHVAETIGPADEPVPHAA
jgi:tetratricopeptide (TPR) repeat protein